MTPAPVNHVEGATAVIDGKLFIFTGFSDAALNPNNRVDVYDPVNNIWETETVPRNPMPFGASHVQGAADGAIVWFAGGFEGQHPGAATADVWRYDSVNDVWAAGPPLPEARASGALVRHGRNLHYIGGLEADRDTDSAAHWVLDLDNPAAWEVAPDLPEARNHMQATTVGEYIYVVGGQFNHDTDPVDLPFLHAFNVTTNTWVQRADLPTARSHFEPGTFSFNERVIGVGGRNNQLADNVLQDLLEYNPLTDEWRVLGTLPEPRIAAVANVIGSTLVVTNGGLDYNIGRQTTWIAPISLRCPQPQVVQAPPRTIDLDLSNTGVLETGGFGAVGDVVTWTLTVTNTGGVPEDVVLDSVLDSNLQIENISLDPNRGNAQVNGQVVNINIPALMTGESVSFTITTTLIDGVISGVLTNNATVQNNGENVVGQVRVLPPVTVLPATGESPMTRPLTLMMLALIGVSGVALVSGSVMVYRRSR